MATEFDRIKSLAGWRAKLEELLGAAREAAQQDDFDTRLEVADRLTQFIVCNPPEVPDDPETAEYTEMDRLAKEAHDGLLLASIQERVAAIMSRTAEFAALRKQIEAQANANAQAAASIRLEKARKVVDATTNAVAAMMDLKKQVESAAKDGQASDFTALGKQLEKAIESIQALRHEVETKIS